MAQVTVTGEVVYVHPKFIAVLEDNGKTKRRWQVWDVVADKGAHVTVAGELRTKVGDPYGPEQRVGVDHAIGRGVLKVEAAQAGPAWGTDAETPF